MTAALAAVRRHGHDIGLDEVAAELGVSKSVVYRHFADRADLFGAVLDRVADEVLMPQLLGELAGLGADDGDVETVRGVVQAYVSVIESEPELYRFVLRHAGQDRLDDFVAATEARVALALSTLVGDRLRALGMDSGGAEVWAFGVVGMVQLAAQRWADQRSMSADALVDYLTMLVWGGLKGVLASGGSPARFAEESASVAADRPDLRLLRPVAGAGAGSVSGAGSVAGGGSA